MHRQWLIYVFFTFLLACSADPGKTEAHRDYARDPFNRQAPIVLTRHARCRMDCRHITEKEVHEILDGGTINYGKSEPDHHPDPKYALDGYTAEHQHLRIVVAPEPQKLIVVTCIELDVEWTCHCD